MANHRNLPRGIMAAILPGWHTHLLHQASAAGVSLFVRL